MRVFALHSTASRGQPIERFYKCYTENPLNGIENSGRIVFYTKIETEPTFGFSYVYPYNMHNKHIARGRLHYYGM